MINLSKSRINRLFGCIAMFISEEINNTYIFSLSKSLNGIANLFVIETVEDIIYCSKIS